MRFESLEFFARSSTGWRSGELKFGKTITQLFAANGSGKTPLIQSILFCLGMEIHFREDVIRNCRMIRLKALFAGTVVSFERLLTDQFDITIKFQDNTEERFYNEENFSRYMLKKLNLRDDRLLTNGNTPTIPYFSAILPLFYLDQDQGYSDYYVPARQGFIKSQFSEMMRLVIGLPPQSAYDKRKQAIDVKKELEYLDRTIVDSQRLLERLRQDLPSPTRKPEEIELLISNSKARLDELKTSKDIKSESLSSLDYLISSWRKQHHELSAEEASLESKVRSSVQIRDEIQSEIETLKLNEEARHAFTSFTDICSAPSCGMFLASADSYGKSLLYLRDQIKDLEITTASNIQKAEAISIQKTTIERQISDLGQKRGIAERESGVEIFIEAISQIASEIFELQLEKGKLEKLDTQKERHLKLLNQRDRSLSIEESLKPAREQSPDILRFRMDLADKMAKWLDILKSKNISRDIRIDSDLKPVLGTEKIGIIKGSSKARTVLAFHGALFEICTSDPDSPFRTLIFDTPRQQEIHWEDLDAYIKELKVIAKKNNAQVIFSTTSYRYEVDPVSDAEWLPGFEGFEQPMYLGTAQ